MTSSSRYLVTKDAEYWIGARPTVGGDAVHRYWQVSRHGMHCTLVTVLGKDGVDIPRKLHLGTQNLAEWLDSQTSVDVEDDLLTGNTLVLLCGTLAELRDRRTSPLQLWLLLTELGWGRAEAARALAHIVRHPSTGG